MHSQKPKFVVFGWANLMPSHDKVIESENSSHFGVVLICGKGWVLKSHGHWLLCVTRVRKDVIPKVIRED